MNDEPPGRSLRAARGEFLLRAGCAAAFAGGAVRARIARCDRGSWFRGRKRAPRIRVAREGWPWGIAVGSVGFDLNRKSFAVCFADFCQESLQGFSFGCGNCCGFREKASFLCIFLPMNYVSAGQLVECARDWERRLRNFAVEGPRSRVEGAQICGRAVDCVEIFGIFWPW